MRFILSLVMVATLLSCNAQQNSDQTEQTQQASEAAIYTDVSNDEAHNLMESRPNLIIVDVRTDGEVAAGMIKGAKQIDISQPSFESKLGEISRDAPILVYCAGGVRSKKAQEQMREMGFKEVHNLARGYSNWK